jgi:hypothetical protein
MPGIVARREAAPLPEGRRVAGYAVAGMERLKRKLNARQADACRAGGECHWRPVVKPAAEVEPWPPGRWEHCAACHSFRKVGES